MIEGTLKAVLGHWDDMPAACPCPSALDYWVDGTGAERVCAFLFPKGSTRPCLVVKVMRSSAGARRLRREHRLVTRLREACPADVAEAIPTQALTEGPHGLFVAEEYVEGTSLARLVSGRRDPAGSSVPRYGGWRNSVWPRDLRQAREPRGRGDAFWRGSWPRSSRPST